LTIVVALRVEQALDFDRSPGTVDKGDPVPDEITGRRAWSSIGPLSFCPFGSTRPASGRSGRRRPWLPTAWTLPGRTSRGWRSGLGKASLSGKMVRGLPDGPRDPWRGLRSSALWEIKTMATITHPGPSAPPVTPGLVLSDVPWADYEAMHAVPAESPVAINPPRLSPIGESHW